MPAEIRARALSSIATTTLACARLSIDLGGLPGTATFEVEAEALARWVDVLSGGPGTSTPAHEPTFVELAAFELLTLIAIDALLGDPAIDALAPRLVRDAAPLSGSLTIQLEIVLAGISGRGWLQVPQLAVAQLREIASALPAPIARTVVELSYRSGSADLTAVELDGLEPGDVVVLDAPSPVLRSEAGLSIRGRTDGEQFHMEEIEMTEVTASYPVRVEVELGRVSMTLSELARLEPGAAIPLGLDRKGFVTLRVGERAIAQGELVNIEGAVGVRIARLGG